MIVQTDDNWDEPIRANAIDVLEPIPSDKSPCCVVAGLKRQRLRIKMKINDTLKYVVAVIDKNCQKDMNLLCFSPVISNFRITWVSRASMSMHNKNL